MALSIDELRRLSQQKAQQQDQLKTEMTSRVVTVAKRADDWQSARIASRLDNPISSPGVNTAVKARQSAQIASRLDNSLINKATKGPTNPAEMYRPGNVTESLFKTPNYISDNAMTEMVDRANARWALQQDNTATEKAREAAKKSAEQQKAAMERMVSDLYQKMEGYKNNGQTDELFKAEQEYAKLNDSIAQMNSKIHGSAMEEAKDWETQRYNEIMSTGGRVLLANLERLAELSDNRIKEADDERRNGLTETETEYYDLYNNLKAKYGEQVDSWLEYAKRMGNKSQMAMSTAKARQAAEDKPFWASVGSVPLNMASGAGYLDVIGQNLQRSITGSDAPIDYNSPAQTASKMTGAIRGTVSEGMGKFGSFLYNTGMSMADTLAAMPMGNFGMAMLGGSAATNAMQTAIERGASDGQALKIGLAAGAMETVMEKLSIDNLFKLKTPEAAKDVILNILKQAGAEGAEEGLTTLANTLADALIMGNRSELQTQKRELMAQGYTEKEAERMAATEWVKNLALDIAGGAFSGGVFGSVKTGSDVVRNGGFQKPTVESVMPKPRQTQPPVADITPTPQQAQEAPTPASVMPKLQQTQREQAAPVKPVQTQTTPGQKVSDVVSRITGENTGAPVGETATETTTQTEPTIEFTDGTRQTQAEFVETYQAEFPRATEAEAVDTFRYYEQLNANGIKVPKVETEETVQAQPNTDNATADILGKEQDAQPAMGAADAGFSPYSNYQNTQSSFIPEGANAARPVDVPSTDPTGKNTRRFLSNAMGAQAINENTDARLQSDFMEGKYGYDIKGDPEAVQKANDALKQDGYDFVRAQTLERLQSMKNLKQTVVDAQLLALEAQRKGNDADAAEILLLLAETGTEFGQAVQAYSIFRKLTPEGQLAGVRRVIQRLNEKLEKKGWELSVDPVLEQEFLNAPDEQTRTAVMEKIYQDIGSKLPTTLGEIANQWRYTAMLLNPSTHAKNIIGSGTQFGMSMIKDALAVPGEALANKISGGKTGRTKAYLNLKSEADQKLLNIAGQYYDANRDDIMGESQYSNTPEGKINQYKTTMKLNNPQNKVAKAVDAILRGAGKAADWNMDVMDIEDAWFSRPRFQTALAGYMKANGLNEVTDEAYKYAKSEAQKATYRDMNAVSEWASKLGRKTDNPIGKIVRFVINANIPFKKSVANVGVRAVEYSPLGLIKTGTDIAKAAYRKDASAVAGIINDLAANATGSLLYALGIELAKNGLLRARGAEDDKEREQLKREGYKDNALYVVDVAIPIAFLGAASIPLLLGASTYEAVARANNSEEGLTWQDYISIGASSLDPLAETTMLQGVKDAIETFVGNNPQASLMEAMTFGLMETVGNYFESFIPSVISRTANSLDHAARQTYVEPDSQFPELSKVLQGLQYKIPGARNQMVERVDAYGDKVSGGLPDTGNKLLDVMGAIGNAVTPTYPGKIKTTAVDEEMRRLYNVEGLDKDDRTVFISDAPKHFEADGKEVYLTGDQYEEYQKTRNSSIQQIRDDVMNSDRYDELPDDIKLRAMSDAANYANALAKAGLDVGYKIKTKWMNELAGATPEEVADAIITRSIENAAEDYEGGKYAGLGDMLDSGTFEDKIAISLLPQEQYDRYMKYGKGVPAADLMDALAYKNSDASKGLKDEDGKDIKGETRQDHVKAWLDEKYKGSANRKIKIGIWCTLYAESTCPW